MSHLARYSLADLQLIEPDHVYMLGGSIQLYGTTTLMRKYGLGFQGVAPQSALARGTWCHDASVIEDEGDLDWSAIPQDYLGYMQAYREARAHLGVRNVAAEWMSFHRAYAYAGKCDRIVVDKRGRLSVLELKTGHHGDWQVQAAAYRELRQHWFPESKIAYGILLKVNNDGTYRTEEDSLDAAWQVFAGVLQVHHWQQRNGRRTAA